MLSKEEIIATAEWQALNKLYKTMSPAQRQAVTEEFKLLSEFVKANVGIGPSTEYMRELSQEARVFLVEHTKAGEPNLYHSLMSLIGGSMFEKEEDVLSYYLLKFGRTRPYLSEQPEIVREILSAAWNKQVELGFRPGEGF